MSEPDLGLGRQRMDRGGSSRSSLIFGKPVSFSASLVSFSRDMEGEGAFLFSCCCWCFRFFFSFSESDEEEDVEGDELGALFLGFFFFFAGLGSSMGTWSYFFAI
jgi:hypothetical protein